MNCNIRILQKWFKPFEQTPLHPQWLMLRHRTETISWINRHAHGVLIDIGCGNSKLREKMKSDVTYFSVDYPRTIALGYSGNADIYADAAELPIATTSIDTVTLLDVLEHLVTPEQAISEAARILKKEGKLLIHVPFLYPLHDEPHDYHRWTEYGLRALLKRHDLEIEEINESTSPSETAAALFAIALSKSMIDASRNSGLILLVSPLVLSIIPIINITGWALGKLMPSPRFMPFSYRITARKHQPLPPYLND